MSITKGSGAPKEAPSPHSEQWSRLIKGHLSAYDEHPWFQNRESYLVMIWLTVMGPATRAELSLRLGLEMEIVSDCIYRLKMYKLLETKKQKKVGKKIEEIHATGRGEQDLAEYNHKVTLFENSVHSQLSSKLVSPR